MTLLKAYCNLDLRAASVDSVGRLTTDEERRIQQYFNTVYPNRVSLPVSKLDYAYARASRKPCSNMIITVRVKELPANNRVDDPNMIVGVLIGHLATSEDKQAIVGFKKLKPTINIRQKMDNLLISSDSVIIIDGFINVSKYSDSSMLAFLLRKMQASIFGQCLSIICWYTTKLDKNTTMQLGKFGYKPHGVGLFKTFNNSIIKDGVCLTFWGWHTFDQRELKKPE